jgi:hypothetical protein
MLKKIELMLVEHSQSFKNMSATELALAEKELQRIELALTNVAFPRLLDAVEKDNPEYQALGFSFESNAMQTKDLAS